MSDARSDARSNETGVPNTDVATNGASATPEQIPTAPVLSSDVPFDPAHSVTRLLVGGALEGSDELMRRLRQWEASAQVAAQTTPYPTETSQADEFRYAMIGLLLEGETRARQGLQRLEQMTSATTQRVTRTVAPNGWTPPRGMLGRRLDNFVARRQQKLAHWREIGRQAEREGRLTAREALANSTHEVFGYMAQEPQVRDLIEQQGMTLASTALDGVRVRTASADRWVERVVRRALRMGSAQGPASPTPTPSASEAPAPVAPSAPRAASPSLVAPASEPASPQSSAAGRLQWTMDGPAEVC
jgi:hypothetical protein